MTAHLDPWKYKPGQSGYTGVRKRRLAMHVIRAEVDDAQAQLAMLARIARGETVRVEQVKRDKLGRPIYRELRPTLRDVQAACVYLIDRRWGRIPGLVIEETKDEPGAGLPEIPDHLQVAVRALARQLVLGVAEHTAPIEAERVPLEPAARPGGGGRGGQNLGGPLPVSTPLNGCVQTTSDERLESHIREFIKWGPKGAILRRFSITGDRHEHLGDRLALPEDFDKGLPIVGLAPANPAQAEIGGAVGTQSGLTKSPDSAEISTGAIREDGDGAD